MSQRSATRAEIAKQEFEEACFDDPVFFSENVLGVRLWEIQKTILRALAKNRRVAVKACHASGKCVESSELITLADGRRVRAGDLIGKKFRLLTLLQDGTQVPADARAAFNAIEPVYTVTTESGRRITRNAQHPLWMAKGHFPAGNRCKIEPQGWTPIKQIESGDLVATTSRLDASYGTHESMPEDELKVLAYLIGDGGYTASQVVFTQQDNAQLAEFRACAERLGAQLIAVPNYGYRVTGVGKTRQSQCAGVHGVITHKLNPIVDLLTKHGMRHMHSRDKRVPEIIFSLARSQIATFLSRLYSTDGWASLGKNNVPQVGFCSASEGLCQDLQELLLRFGVSARLRPKPKVRAWCLEISDSENLLRFIREIGIYGKEDAVETVRVRAEAMAATKQRRVWRHKHCLSDSVHWERVVSVEYAGVKPTVAIEVPSTHAYLTTFYEHNSFLASCAVLWWYSTRFPSITFTTAPTTRQVERVLWKDISTLHANAKLPIPGRLYDVRPQIQYSRDHWAYGFSTDKGDSFQGLHAVFMLGVYDEAVGIEPDIWEAGDGNLASGDTHLLTLANPTNPDCEFARECQSDGTVVFSISAYDTPYFTELGITEEMMLADPDSPNHWSNFWFPEKCSFHGVPLCDPFYVQQQLQKNGYMSPQYVARVLGEFPDTATDTLIPYSKIIKARDRWIEYQKYTVGQVAEEPEIRPEGGIQLGVDVADQGSDLTARCIAQGLVVEHVTRDDIPEGADYDDWINARAFGNRKVTHGVYIHPFRTKSYDEAVATAKLVASDIEECKPEKITIDGQPPGVCSILRAQGYQINKVLLGSKPINAKDYRDLKAEWYSWLKRLFVEDMIAIPPDDELIQELAAIKYDFVEATGQMFILPKLQIRKTLKRSPDKADALMLAVAPANFYYIADGEESNGTGSATSPGAAELEARAASTVANFMRQIGARP